MDLLTIVAILGAAYNLFKMIKEIYQGKGWNWWLVSIETLLIVVIIFGITYGTLFKSQRDEDRHKEIVSKLDSTGNKTDSATKAMQDSADAREKRIEKANQPKNNNEVDRKPNFDLFPPKYGFNPYLESTGKDTFLFSFALENRGNGFGNRIHILLEVLDQRANDDTLDGPVSKRNYVNHDEKIYPNDGLSASLQIFNIGRNPIQTEYVVLFFCYSDSLNRQDGPIFRVKKFKSDELRQGSIILDEEDRNRIEEILRRKGEWVTKFF